MKLRCRMGWHKWGKYRAGTKTEWYAYPTSQRPCRTTQAFAKTCDHCNLVTTKQVKV